jgi:hypothetical protein
VIFIRAEISLQDSVASDSVNGSQIAQAKLISLFSNRQTAVHPHHFLKNLQSFKALQFATVSIVFVLLELMALAFCSG